MSAETQSELQDRATVTLVLHQELIIDCPVNDLWPRLFEYNEWNPQHRGARVTRLSGHLNQEGDVRLELKKNGDDYLPPIILEIVRIVPYKKIVWKMYEPQDGPEVSFVDFSLEGLGSKTRFIYNFYGEFLKNKRKEMPSEQEYMEILGGIFQELKRYTEAR